ncbi:hypothetical protein [Pseudomonas brassicacearum]|nr:hypothetical protein [Pseudomonas brassicacearum]
MLTSEEEIQALTDKIRPDQTLDSNFDLISSIKLQKIGFTYTNNEITTEVTGNIDLKSRTIEIHPLQKLNASSTHCLSYLLGAAVLFNSDEISSISASKNIIDLTLNKNHSIPKSIIESKISLFINLLLMPRKLTERLVDQLMSDFDIKDHNHGLIYVDYQECNHTQYVKMINNICSIMSVSSNFAISRLTELEILKDTRTRKPKNWSTYVDDPKREANRKAEAPRRVYIDLDKESNQEPLSD